MIKAYLDSTHQTVLFFTISMQAIYFFQAQIAKMLLTIYKMAGLRVGSWLGGLLGKMLGKIARERHIAAHNLSMALPHLSEAEQKRILNQCWTQLGRVIGEFPHMARIAREAQDRVQIEGAVHAEEALQNGGPAMFVSGHFANWELMMLGIQRFAGKTGSLYRRANNPFMEKWIIDQRSAFMPVQIPKGSDGARAMIDLLKNDTSLGVLVDQKLGRGDPIEFFGRATKAPSAPIKLARRFDIPVIPTVIRRLKNGPDKVHFVQHFFPAIHVSKTENMRQDIDIAMRQVYDLLEQWIIERPEEWFWQHNRWK